MKLYKFKWKRNGHLLWKTDKVIGHGFSAELDRITLFFPDGSIREIAKWSECSCKLGVDWVLATKSKMEQEAGTALKINQM